MQPCPVFLGAVSVQISVCRLMLLYWVGRHKNLAMETAEGFLDRSIAYEK
jgi:hypothetical protein